MTTITVWLWLTTIATGEVQTLVWNSFDECRSQATVINTISTTHTAECGMSVKHKLNSPGVTTEDGNNER